MCQTAPSLPRAATSFGTTIARPNGSAVAGAVPDGCTGGRNSAGTRA